MSCYRPTLPNNATYDVCCFNNLECAKAVCGSFDILNQSGINNTVVQANGTQYCYGYGDLINQSYTSIRNETCGTTGFECSFGKANSRHSSSTTTINPIHPTFLGVWFMGLWILSKFSHN